MAQVQEVWNKLNPRERFTTFGVGMIVVGFLLSALDYSAGGTTLALLAALAVLVVFYLKYAPNQSINWPAPVSTIVLGLSAVALAAAALEVLRWVSFILNNILGLWTWGTIIVLVGSIVMVWQSWLEYQATQPASSSVGTPTTQGAAPAAAPPAAPAAPPAAPATPDVAPPPADSSGDTT
jgi:hypothetical protein